MRFPVHIPAKVLPAVAGSAIHVYQAGTTTHIPYTIYSDSTSASTLAQGYSHPGGDIVFYLPVPAQVSVGAQAVGAPAPTVAAPVNTGARQFNYGTMKIGGRVSDWVLS